MRRSLTTLAAVVLLAACRSPFGVAPQAETGPDAGKVGRGVHGWPLLEHAPHGDGWRTDVLWPGYSAVRSDGDGLNSTALVIPVFLFESEGERTRTGVLRPLFDLETRGEETFDLDVLWPLVKWVDAPGETVRRFAPFYSQREGEDGGHLHLWPLYGRKWSGSQEKEWVLTPLFSHDEDPERDISLWHAPWPLVHFGHAGDDRQVRALPFLWHEEDGDDHVTVAFPFVWDIAENGETFEMVFPFFARGDSPNGDYLRSVLPPLWFRVQDRDELHTVLAAGAVGWMTAPDRWSGHLFPVLWLERHDDGDAVTHLWPLAGWERNGDRREASTLWPLFRYEWHAGDDDDRKWELDAPWPFVRVARSSARDETYVWPLFSHEEWEASEGEPRTAGNVLLFVSSWESRADDESDFRLLWKLVESTRHAGKDTFVVNPLFRHETNDAGDSYWSFLFGLIARKQEAGAVDWRFLWLL